MVLCILPQFQWHHLSSFLLCCHPQLKLLPLLHSSSHLPLLLHCHLHLPCLQRHPLLLILMLNVTIVMKCLMISSMTLPLMMMMGRWWHCCWLWWCVWVATKACQCLIFINNIAIAASWQLHWQPCWLHFEGRWCWCMSCQNSPEKHEWWRFDECQSITNTIALT